MEGYTFERLWKELDEGYQIYYTYMDKRYMLSKLAKNCYSRQLVIAHQEMINKLGDKLNKAGKIACDAIEQQQKVTGEFANASALEVLQYEKLVSNVESVLSELSCVNELYDDVCRLSDLLSSLEQYAAQKRADTPQVLY